MHPIQDTTTRPADDEALFESIAAALESQGYVILPAALPPALAASLLDCLAILEQDQFHTAGVGRGRDQVHNQFVRRNSIHWIEEDDIGSGPWLAWTTRLRLYLNRRLFLGLFSFESHLSLYQVGDFYRKHVDAFKGDSNRILSLVVYLNKGWEPDQGGSWRSRAMPPMSKFRALRSKTPALAWMPSGSNAIRKLKPKAMAM